LLASRRKKYYRPVGSDGMMPKEGRVARLIWEFRIMKSLTMFCLVSIVFLAPAVSRSQTIGESYDSGLEKSSKGDYYGAIADFTKVIEQYPNEAKPYHYRGINKFNLKDYEGAIADFTKAISLNPKFADAYYMRGMARVGARQKDEACPDFQKASDLGNTAARYALDKYCR
jgi:tetratricopeptide (TPR) repeat protein